MTTQAIRAEAARRANYIIANSPSPAIARQRAYESAMHALNGRNRREQRITDLAQEIVEAAVRSAR